MSHLEAPPAAETWARGARGRVLGPVLRRVLGRTAGSVGAAVVLAGLVPALANAAGANVPNPVAIALRASGDTLHDAFGTAAEPCTEPAASPSPAESPAESPVPVSSEQPDCDENAPPGSSPSAAPSPAGSEESDAEAGEHGTIVSTVARCAPHGKDVLLAVEGAPGSHGSYVRAAAHGDSLTTPWGTFDLSTLAGAEQLCAALDAARATSSPAPEAKEAKHATKQHEKKAKSPRSGR